MRTIIRITKAIFAILFSITAIFMLSYGIGALLSPDTYFMNQATESGWDKIFWVSQSLGSASAFGLMAYMLVRKTHTSRIHESRENRVRSRFGMAYMASVLMMVLGVVYTFMLNSPL